MNKIFNSIWREFIYGGHLLSLGASGIVYTVSRLVRGPISLDFLLIAYLGIQASYMFNRYKEIGEDFETNPERTAHLQRYLVIMPALITIMFVLLFVIMFLTNHGYAWWFTFFPLSIGILYSLFLKNLTRYIIGFKTIVVSFGWALYLPFYIVYYRLEISMLVFCLLCSFIFLRWVINTSLFDVKDIVSDQEKDLKTIPAFLGKIRYFKFISLINLISFLPLIIGIVLKLFPAYSLLLFLIFPYSIYFIYGISHSKGGDMKPYSIVDAEFLLWGVITYMGFKLWTLC